MVEPNRQLDRPIWWAHDKVLLRRKVFALAPQFQIFDMQGGLLLHCQQKLWKLREDIRVYADTTKQHEILTIQARQIIDFSAAYDIVDSQTQEKVGALRRRGLKSIIRDEWDILGVDDQVIGKVQEDGLALLRRFIKLIPQKYAITLGSTQVGLIKQAFNPFVFKATMDLSLDPERHFDRRLALATGLLLMAIEGRQE